MSLLVGIDTGGTFTDFVLYDQKSRRIIRYKYPSTPHNPSEALLKGLETLFDNEKLKPGEIEKLNHGTTVATNALLQDRLPDIGMITTRGFRDILELGRQRRPHLYNLDIDKPKSPAPRRFRFELNERIDADGNIQTKLDQEELNDIIANLRSSNVPAIAVCLLHSYKNPSHEIAVRDTLSKLLPGSLVSISSEVMQEFREFDRFSSTVLNAALLPVMRGYLDELSNRTRSFGISSPPLICSSYGCNVSIETAKEMPITTMVSGPSAGVVGAVAIGHSAGFNNLITLDMGGTSTDVCLIQDSSPLISRQREIGGWPVTVPSVDVLSIGAGGGSILWLDEGGFLQVGPKSAGAVPGPVCYNLGGDRPTLTDANVLARRLTPEINLGGVLKLTPELAERSIKKLIAEPLGFDTNKTLDGIFKVLNSNLLRTVRAVSVERGYDPRECALVAFGGAGPLHATQLAQEIGVQTVLIPESPGVLCALGLLMADIRGEFSQSNILMPTYGNNEKNKTIIHSIRKVFQQLERQAIRWLEIEKINKDEASIHRTIEARYVGQGHEISIEADNFLEDPKDIDGLIDKFHAAYEDKNGYFSPKMSVEFVHFRLQLIAPGPRPNIVKIPAGDGNYSRAVYESREVYLGDTYEFQDCPVYLRSKLLPDDRFNGPAIIEQMDSTTLVLPNQEVYVDERLNLIINVNSI